MTRVISTLITKCGKCGAPITSHGVGTKLCLSCIRVEPTSCKTCGGPMPKYSKAVQCRACWKARGARPKAQRTCAKCGTPLSLYISPAHTLCKPCRTNPIPTCVDCGKNLQRNSKSIHCWECYSERRIRVKEKKRCTIEGCLNPHTAKGLCAIHYERMRVTRSRGGKHIDTHGRIWVAQQPCQLCGYNRLRSHVHRLIAQGDYVVGNMIALCSRCHDEVHRGLTPCPQPLGPY